MQAGNHVSGVGSGSYSNSCGAGSLRAKVMLDISSLKGFARRSMTSGKNRVGRRLANSLNVGCYLRTELSRRLTGHTRSW